MILRIAIVAILCSLTCATHPPPKDPGDIDNELTFFKVCWFGDPDTDTMYPAYPPNSSLNAISGACDDPQDIIWDESRLPLRVTIDGMMPEKQQLAVVGALDYWNAIVGRRLFAVSEYSWDIRVTYNTENTITGSTLSAAFHHVDAGHLAGEVLIFPISEEEYSLEECLTIQKHEFGHILGLHHDVDKPESLMYPYIRRDGDQDLTSADEQALRDRYAIKDR